LLRVNSQFSERYVYNNLCSFILINKYGETRVYIKEALFLNFKIRDMIRKSIEILQLRITQRDATKDFILNSELM